MDKQRANNHDEKCSTSSRIVVNEVVLENSIKETDDSISNSNSNSNSIDENKKAKGVINLDGDNLLVGKEELKVSNSTSSSCAIDVKLDDENDREMMVCRICHLNSDQYSPEREFTNVDGKMMKESSLIKLGCGCKDDLGVAHSHCAEAWFKLKGNKICEICGEGARNVRGIIQEQMDVEWNDRGSYANYSPETQPGWWRGQPCCNFLMACLIVAFVLPWFFRVKIV